MVLIRKFNKGDLKYILDNISKDFEVVIPEEYSDENLSTIVKDADVLMGFSVSKKVLEAAENLKVFQVPAAGIDRLDLSLFKNKEVKVCNSHSNASYVAEYAIGLMFTLVKKIANNDRNMRKGKWLIPSKNPENIPDNINGKTIGFLGFGNIGQNIASCLCGFDIDILAFDEKKILHKDIKNLEFASFEKVLKNSDIIFNVLPLTEETEDLIKIKEFKMMKKTAFLINISRGKIINEKDLFQALKEKIIAGAAIDVWYDEVYRRDEVKYPSKKYEFHKLENIVLSPYTASISKDKSTHLIDAIKNLNNYVEGKELSNIININKGY